MTKLVTAVIQPHRLDDVKSALVDILVPPGTEIVATVPVAWDEALKVPVCGLKPSTPVLLDGSTAVQGATPVSDLKLLLQQMLV